MWLLIGAVVIAWGIWSYRHRNHAALYSIGCGLLGMPHLLLMGERNAKFMYILVAGKARMMFVESFFEVRDLVHLMPESPTRSQFQARLDDASVTDAPAACDVILAILDTTPGRQKEVATVRRLKTAFEKLKAVKERLKIGD